MGQIALECILKGIKLAILHGMIIITVLLSQSAPLPMMCAWRIGSVRPEASVVDAAREFDQVATGSLLLRFVLQAYNREQRPNHKNRIPATLRLSKLI